MARLLRASRLGLVLNAKSEVHVLRMKGKQMTHFPPAFVLRPGERDMPQSQRSSPPCGLRSTYVGIVSVPYSSNVTAMSPYVPEPELMPTISFCGLLTSTA